LRQRVIALVAAYAIAFAGVISGLVAAQAAAETAGRTDPILCHSSAATTTLPDAPRQIPVGDNHCAFCVSGPPYVNCAWPRVPYAERLAMIAVPPPLAPPRLIARVINENTWPRGPPIAA
jgi:hypothetical protein